MGSITLEHVNKSFGDHAVIPDASLEIEDGAFVVFVGPSGCGKSTLLRLIAGLEDTSSGLIRLDGEDVTRKGPAQRQLAMVFQSYALYPHMTVRQNINFPLKMAGIDRAAAAEKVAAAARVLNLTDYLDRKPRQLSGGQRQRVAIGRAIVRDPKVFLFDEPLSNLDAELRVQMRVEISRLHKELGTTMIYVTHDQTEAMTLADRIVVLRAGNVEQIGRPLDLYADPDNQFVAGFVGSPKMNFLAAEIIGDGAGGVTIELVNQGRPRLVVPLAGDVPASGTPVTLGVRPEHFGPRGAGDCDITVVVDVAEHLGSTSYAYANTGSGEELVIARDPAQRDTDIASLTVSIAADRAFLFEAGGKRLR